MSDPEGSLSWRIAQAEKRIDDLYRLDPSVIKERVDDLRFDLREIRKDVTWIKRTFIGFCVTFAFSGITMVLLLTAGRH